MSKKKADNYVMYVIDTLAPLCEVKVRTMFGGYGLYNCGTIFAIIAEQELYFKARNDGAREFFARIGSVPFMYEKNGKMIAMSYWKISDEILHDRIILESALAFALLYSK